MVGDPHISGSPGTCISTGHATAMGRPLATARWDTLTQSPTVASSSHQILNTISAKQTCDLESSDLRSFRVSHSYLPFR